VYGKMPPHVLESEWVAAIEAVLVLQFSLPCLSAAFAEYFEKKTSGCVGRGHIFAEIRRILKHKQSGHITVAGESGIGKTAILSELVKRERGIAHFLSRTLSQGDFWGALSGL